jgi:hypothetical protein
MWNVILERFVFDIPLKKPRLCATSTSITSTFYKDHSGDEPGIKLKYVSGFMNRG